MFVGVCEYVNAFSWMVYKLVNMQIFRTISFNYVCVCVDKMSIDIYLFRAIS